MLPLLAVGNLPVEVIFRLTATVVHIDAYRRSVHAQAGMTIAFRPDKQNDRLWEDCAFF
jgi:hypothetical protein